MDGKNDAAEYPFNETFNSQWWLLTEVALDVVVAAVAITLAMMLSVKLSPAPPPTNRRHRRNRGNAGHRRFTQPGTATADYANADVSEQDAYGVTARRSTCKASKSPESASPAKAAGTLVSLQHDQTHTVGAKRHRGPFPAEIRGILSRVSNPTARSPCRAALCVKIPLDIDDTCP